VKYAGVPSILEEVMRTVDSFKAERLVIDSFTALTQALGEKIEARLILHNTLSKIINRMGCTTLIIVETPIGTEQLGMGLEEFVSDTLLIMRREMTYRRAIRKLEIRKSRGSPIERPTHLFTLRNGVEILPPFKPEKRILRPFKPIPDSKDYFSTGNEQLDNILGRGLPKGSVLLEEVDATIPQQALLLINGVIVKNWVGLGKSIVIMPHPLLPPRKLKLWLKNDLKFSDEVVSRQIRMMLRKDDAYRSLKDERVTVFDGKDPREDITVQIEALKDSREKTGKPILMYLPVDFIHAFYKDELEDWLNTLASEIIENGDLLLIHVSMKSPITRYLSSLALTHVKLVGFQGDVLLCCEKPWSKLYHMAQDIDREGVAYKLTPIM